MVAPPDAELAAMRPKKDVHIKTLIDSAVIAGYDAEGITNKRTLMTPQRKSIRMASEDGPPVLTIKLREEPKPEPKDDTPLESWEDIEFGIDKMIAHISQQRKVKSERNSE